MSMTRIRQAVHQMQYEFTAHAIEEMDDDGLTEADVRRVLLSGSIGATLADDPRGLRFVVRSEVHDSEVEVVCRFLPSGILRIITVYVLDK